MLGYLKEIYEHVERYKRKVVVHDNDHILHVADDFLLANQWGKDNYGTAWETLHYFYVPSRFDKVRLLTLRLKNLITKEWLPTFPVKFFRDSVNFIEAEMLVDSGADITFINYNTGISIGFTRTLGDKIEQAEGVGGDVPHILKNIEVEIDGYRFQVEVGWCIDEDIDDLLLGRQDVFDFFNVEFRQSESRIVFKPTNTTDEISQLQ